MLDAGALDELTREMLAGLCRVNVRYRTNNQNINVAEASDGSVDDLMITVTSPTRDEAHLVTLCQALDLLDRGAKWTDSTRQRPHG